MSDLSYALGIRNKHAKRSIQNKTFLNGLPVIKIPIHIWNLADSGQKNIFLILIDLLIITRALYNIAFWIMDVSLFHNKSGNLYVSKIRSR